MSHVVKPGLNTSIILRLLYNGVILLLFSLFLFPFFIMTSYFWGYAQKEKRWTQEVPEQTRKQLLACILPYAANDESFWATNHSFRQFYMTNHIQTNDARVNWAKPTLCTVTHLSRAVYVVLVFYSTALFRQDPRDNFLIEIWQQEKHLFIKRFH